jgi:hypothetical protein
MLWANLTPGGSGSPLRRKRTSWYSNRLVWSGDHTPGSGVRAHWRIITLRGKQSPSAKARD